MRPLQKCGGFLYILQEKQSIAFDTNKKNHEQSCICTTLKNCTDIVHIWKKDLTNERDICII